MKKIVYLCKNDIIDLIRELMDNGSGEPEDMEEYNKGYIEALKDLLEEIEHE
jgi:hypothetical protein